MARACHGNAAWTPAGLAAQGFAMTFSLFDWLVISFRLKERREEASTLPGLTQEETRELRRMREEVRRAREDVQGFVARNRGNAF